MPKPDASQEAAKAVARITGTRLPKGESLLGSPELRRQLREAKARLRSQPGRK